MSGKKRAAAVIGAVAIAAVAHPTEFWMRHGIPAMFTRSRPTASRSDAPVVSETEKREARDLYLKGRYEWGQRTSHRSSVGAAMLTAQIHIMFYKD